MTAPRRVGTDPLAAARAMMGELGELAVAVGQPGLRDEIAQELARWTSTAVTVVVAGLTGSGKSLLINAVLGKPGLLPVGGSGSSTAVHVVVRHAPHLALRVHPEGGGPPTSESPDAVRDWVTHQGNPRNRRRVQAVEIGIPHALLGRGLAIVDTPGIAAAETGDVDATVAALNWADAVLFATSARAPLSSAEVAFLGRAAERISTVVVALTATDAYPGWRDVLAQDLATIEREGRPSATGTVIPVSGRLRQLAERYRRDGDAVLARELVVESGFPELAAALDRRILGRSRAIRLANVLRLAETVANSIELPERAVLASTGDDAESRRALEAGNARLADASRATAAAAARVHDAFELARLDLTQALNGWMSELSRSVDGAAAGVASTADLDLFAERLTSDLGDIARRLQAALEDRVVSVLEELAAAYAAELAQPTTGPAGTAPVRAADHAPPMVDHGLFGAMRTHYYPFLIGSGIVGTLGSAAGIMVGVTLAAPVAIASLVAGTVTAYLGRRIGERDQSRQRAREMARQAVAEARTELQGWVTRTILELRRQIQDEIRQRLDADAAELRRVVEAEARVAKADRAARARARDQATERLERLNGIRARLAVLRALVTEEPAAD